jgi:hypothetical protein
MGQKIGFYKKEGRWYADLPSYIAAGGTEASCVMVAGADTFLDRLCKGLGIEIGTYIKVEVDIQPFTNVSPLLSSHIKLESVDDVTKKFLEENNHPDVDFGGNYIADIIEGVKSNHRLWLCPVTLHVFPNGYPKELWIRVVQVQGYPDGDYYTFDVEQKESL